MYNHKDEDVLLNLTQGLINNDLGIQVVNIDIEEPENDLNYHIKYKKSYFYKLYVYYKYENSNNLDSSVIYLPKLENNLYYYNLHNTPNLKAMVNTFRLNSPFSFITEKKTKFFKVPRLFTINNTKNTIYYNKELHDLSSLDSLNIKLPDRTWKKLNYYNKNITSGVFTYDIYKRVIYPTLVKYENEFNEIVYYDLDIIPLKDKFMNTIYNNTYINHKLNIHYKKTNKLHLTPLQSAINDFFSMVDNTDIQTIITTNPMSLESQLNKVYIENKNKGKVKIKYNKSFINFLCPVHTHEGTLNNIKNELSNVVDKNTFKLRLLDRNNKEVLVDYYDYFNSYLYINDRVKLHRGEYVESKKWDYIKRSPDDVLSISSACIPLINSTDSVRGILGTTMTSQAIPVTGSTPNIVHTQSEYDIFNRCNLNVFSSHTGTITRITTDNITIDDNYVVRRPESIKSNNNTYNNYNINPELYVGMEVDKNTLLYCLDSFKNNQLCLSVQSRIAYMNYYGYTFEDGIVISSSMADKLTHVNRERLQYGIDNIEGINYVPTKGEILHKNSTVFSYDAGTTNDKLLRIKELFDLPKIDTIDVPLPSHIEDGKIIGTEIVYRDNMSTDFKSKFIDSTYDATIDYNYIVYITVEYYNKAKIGDKVTNRYGSKGVITKVVNDVLMPVDEDGVRVDLIMSPDSIISRKNVAQLPEVELGNILSRMAKMELPTDHEVFKLLYGEGDHSKYHSFAKKYGYYFLKVNSMSNINYNELINKINNLLNIKSYIKLYCPVAKRWLKNDILVGYTSLLRLHFIVEYKSKSSNDYKSNYDGSTYNSDYLLNGGGYNKIEGQKIGEMEFWTLLTHNNMDILKYLQGSKVRKNKIDTLKLSMLQSGIKPTIN